MKFLLRSVHGYPLVGESETSCEGGWAYIRSIVLFREHDGAFVGSLAWRSFPESVLRALRKKGFLRSKRGWRIRVDHLDDYLE